MIDVIQIITTLETRSQAQSLAEALVERKLVACAQVIGPISSTYRWQGQIETSEEWLCVSKTTRAMYIAVESAILEQHPYETPEILSVPCADGSRDYLTWLRASLELPHA